MDNILANLQKFGKFFKLGFALILHYLLTHLLLIQTIMQPLEILIKSATMCRFIAHCQDVLADKPHPQFLWKILSKKWSLSVRVYGI